MLHIDVAHCVSQSVSDSSIKKAIKQKKMFISVDRRFLFGLVLPSTIVVLGGLIWYKKYRQSSTDYSFRGQKNLLLLVDKQIRSNRSEYLVL